MKLFHIPFDVWIRLCIIIIAPHLNIKIITQCTFGQTAKLVVNNRNLSTSD
jgi:hypothetical protein